MPAKKKTAAKKAVAKTAPPPGGRWQSHTASEAAIARFEKSFEKDMGQAPERDDTIDTYEVIPSGSLNLDYGLGVGGYPLGRVIEMWGPEHAGKTTLCILACVEAQKKYPDKMVAWVDMEQTFDRKWAAALGLNLKRMWFHTPTNAEDTADACRRFVESGLCSIVVLDSVGAMIGRVEFEKEADEQTVGIVAKIVTRAVKQVSPIGKSNGTTTIVVNQVRANIGGYGRAEQSGGGWALKHITTIKLWIRRGGSGSVSVKVPGQDDSIPVGHEVAVKVEKNKVAPYGPDIRLWLYNQETKQYGPIGIDKADEATNFGTRLNIIEVGGGGYYTLPNGERIRSKEAVVAYLRNDPLMVEEIRLKAIASLADKFAEEGQEEVPVEDNDPLGISKVPV